MVKGKPTTLVKPTLPKLGIVMSLKERAVGEERDVFMYADFRLGEKPSKPFKGGDAVEHFFPLKGLGSLLGKLYMYCLRERQASGELGSAALVVGADNIIRIHYFSPVDQIDDPVLKVQAAAVIHDIFAKHLLSRFNGEIIHHDTRDIPSNVERKFDLAHMRRVGLALNENYSLRFYARMVSGLAERVKRSQMHGN